MHASQRVPRSRRRIVPLWPTSALCGRLRDRGRLNEHPQSGGFPVVFCRLVVRQEGRPSRHAVTRT